MLACELANWLPCLLACEPGVLALASSLALVFISIWIMDYSMFCNLFYNLFYYSDSVEAGSQQAHRRPPAAGEQGEGTRRVVLARY